MTTPTTTGCLQFAHEDDDSPFDYGAVYEAWLDCRRNKRRSPSAIRFEMDLEANVAALSHELTSRSWHPSPARCFVTRNTKAREIFAASFRDRVVHHLLVSHLRTRWKRVFIHDSYSCRQGKGTHAAVERLRGFLGKVTCNRTRHAHYLQMDIRAFFNSMDRRLLEELVCGRIEHPDWAWLARRILRSHPAKNAQPTCPLSRWEAVSAEKSLFSAPPGRGVPIGNLTSQFFANVYLNELDQYVKHTLKCRYYIRYVDDFVMLHRNRRKLREWRGATIGFLRERLGLRHKASGTRIRAVSSGIDFLGYIVKPTHTLIRRRTIARLREKLAGFEREAKRAAIPGGYCAVDRKLFGKIRSVLASYHGMFGHGCSSMPWMDAVERYPFLGLLFRIDEEGIEPRCLCPFSPRALHEQYGYFRRAYGSVIVFEVGKYLELYDDDAHDLVREGMLRAIEPRPGFRLRCGVPRRLMHRLVGLLRERSAVFIMETGLRGSRIMERMAMHFTGPPQSRHTKYSAILSTTRH